MIGNLAVYSFRHYICSDVKNEKNKEIESQSEQMSSMMYG